MSITSQPASSSGVASSSRTLVVSASGDTNLTLHPVQYQWYEGASGDETNLQTGQTNPTLNVSPSVTKLYWVKVWNGCGAAVRSAAATLTVCAAPTVTNPPSRNITRGQSAAVSVVVTGNDVTIQWYESI
jgi:hypothetical protein